MKNNSKKSFLRNPYQRDELCVLTIRVPAGFFLLNAGSRALLFLLPIVLCSTHFLGANHNGFDSIPLVHCYDTVIRSRLVSLRGHFR